MNGDLPHPDSGAPMDATHLPTRPPSSDPRVAQASLALTVGADAGEAMLDDDWTTKDRSKLMRKVQKEILEHIGERFLDRWSSFTVPLDDEGVTDEKKIRETIRRELKAFNAHCPTFDILLVDDKYSQPTNVVYCWIGDRVICKHAYDVEALEYEPGCKGEGRGRPWQIRFRGHDARRTFTARLSLSLSWEVKRKRGHGSYD